jgi:hypothetical protein
MASASIVDLCAEVITGLDRVERWTHGHGQAEARRIDLAISTVKDGPLGEGERPPITLVIMEG